MQLSIRLAAPGDLAALWPLVCAAVQKMNAQGSEQWGPDYPTPQLYADDIARGQLYCALDDDRVLLGVACVNTDQDPSYAAIPWAHPGPAMVVHRMAVDPQVQRRGVAAALLAHGEALARRGGVGAMHVDTYQKNVGMQALFLSHGYQKTGEIHLHDRPLPFPTYEKILPGHA